MKFTKLILRGFAFILAVLVSANLLICAASYTYLGDPFGLFKVIRIMQIMETHYAGDLDRHTLLSGALHGLVDAAGEKHTAVSGSMFPKRIKKRLLSPASLRTVPPKRPGLNAVI